MRTRKSTSVARTMTLRLDASDLRRLEVLSEATDRSKAWLAAQAVKAYLDINEWQITAIREAVAEADRPDAKFYSNEEVTAWLRSWGTSRERKLSK